MGDTKSRTSEEKRRRAYVPPAIEESGNFERLALACGHTPTGQPGGGGSCDPFRGGTTNS